MAVPSSPAARALTALFTLTLVTHPHPAQAQPSVPLPLELTGPQLHPGVQLLVSAHNARRLLTTADVANPNDVVLQDPGGSPPPSGSPHGINDPALGFNAPRYRAGDAQYSGVTQLVVTYETRDAVTGAITGTPAYLCSGALINGGRSVLTAAHCVFDDPPVGGSVTRLRDVQVLLGQRFGDHATHEPGAGAPHEEPRFAHAQTVSRDHVVIHAGYSGAVIDERDIAVINLNATAPPEYRWYELYAPSALGRTYNVAGWGGRGNGLTGTVDVGGSAGAGQRLRQGLNSFDATYDDPRWNPAFLASFGLGPANVYVADFDSGTSANNALCRLTNATFAPGQLVWLGHVGASEMCGLGLGLDEVLAAGGDSGGPAFVDGQLAGVTSFSQTFGLGDVHAGLNSSFGELSGVTRVDINAGWVASAVVPEPTTVVLLGGGLLALGAWAQRRRR